MQKDVRISFSGTTISVDQKKVQPKAKDDTVGWSGPQQYTLILHLPSGGTQTINSSPQGSQFLASAGPWDSKQNIKYDVHASGFDPLDPDIEVLP